MAVRKGAGTKAPAKNTPIPAKGRAEKKTSSAGKGFSWTVLFWLAFAIFIIGLFLFNRETISSSIQSIRNEITARKTLQGENPVSAPAPSVQPVTAPEAKPSTTTVSPAPAANRSPSQPAPASRQAPASPPAAQPASPARSSPAESRSPTENRSPAPAQPAVQQSSQPAQQTASPAARNTEVVRGTAELRERALYFTQVDRGGSILRIKVNRKIPVSDSPMTDVIQALIAGPSTDEKRRDLMSLIPPDTRILSATVRGETAYISFSEEFQYNTYGVEGYAAQLRQIVYTVTEFSNIRYVQILIEGRRVDYLGEGIWIGSPLSREIL